MADIPPVAVENKVQCRGTAVWSKMSGIRSKGTPSRKVRHREINRHHRVSDGDRHRSGLFTPVVKMSAWDMGNAWFVLMPALGICRKRVRPASENCSMEAVLVAEVHQS